MFDFLKLLLADWRGRMSGSVGLVLTLIGFWVEQKWAKWLFFIVGIFAFLYGAYHVWSKERDALNKKQTELDKERAKSARPDIAVEIQEVYPESAISGTGKHPYYIDEYYTIKAHLVNKGRQIAVRRFELYANTEKGVLPCQLTTFEHLALEREQRVMPKWGVHYSKVETVRETLSDLSKDRTLITHGDNREGWLRFVLPEVSVEQLKEVKGITLWVVDAESNAHKATIGKAQWRQSGKLVNTYYQELQLEVEQLKKNEPNIECEVIEVHIEHPSSSQSMGFHYIFTLNVFLKNTGSVTSVRDYKLRLIQGNHSYEAQKLSVKSYYLEKQEPRQSRLFQGMELVNVHHQLTDLEDMKNLPLDRVGRDGWLRFIVSDVKWADEYEGETHLPKILEIAVIDGDGTAHKFQSPESEWIHEGRIRKYAGMH